MFLCVRIKVDRKQIEFTKLFENLILTYHQKLHFISVFYFTRQWRERERQLTSARLAFTINSTSINCEMFGLFYVLKFTRIDCLSLSFQFQFRPDSRNAGEKGKSYFFRCLRLFHMVKLISALKSKKAANRSNLVYVQGGKRKRKIANGCRHIHTYIVTLGVCD